MCSSRWRTSVLRRGLPRAVVIDRVGLCTVEVLADISKLQFFRYFSYVMSIVCVLFLAISGGYFLRRARTR